MHYLMIILLLLFTIVTEANQPDTLPDPELHPNIPPYLLDVDDHTTTELPYTVMRYPFELPPMPRGYGPVHPVGHGQGLDEDYEEYEDEDWMVHTYFPITFTDFVTKVPITTEDPNVKTDATDATTEDDGFKELGAEHGRLMVDSANKIYISCRLIISMTFLLCIISTIL